MALDLTLHTRAAVEALAVDLIEPDAAVVAYDVLERLVTTEASRVLLELYAPGPEGRYRALDFAFSQRHPQELRRLGEQVQGRWAELLRLSADWWESLGAQRSLITRAWIEVDSSQANDDVPVSSVFFSTPMVATLDASAAEAFGAQLEGWLGHAFSRERARHVASTWVVHERTGIAQIGFFSRPSGLEARALHVTPPLPPPCANHPPVVTLAEEVWARGLGLTVQLVTDSASRGVGRHVEVMPKGSSPAAQHALSSWAVARDLLSDEHRQAIDRWCTTRPGGARAGLNHIKARLDEPTITAKVYLNLRRGSSP